MLTAKEIQKGRKIFRAVDERATTAFKALSDLNRYRIFRILTEHPQISISNIADIMDISLPLASQHIKVLEQAGLLRKERIGKTVLPKLVRTDPFVQAIVKTITPALK